MRSITKSGRKNSVKLLASAALVVGAAGVAGLGTFGSFTSSTAADTAVGTGTVELVMANQATRGLDVAITNMVPGDTAQRAVQLTRATGSETFAGITLTSSLRDDNLLKSGANGLQLQVDGCSVAWVKAPTTNELTCSGTTTPVLATGVATNTDVSLPAALVGLNDASIANLRLQVSLPQAADNAYQNLNNSLKVSFTATQRVGEAR